MTLADESGVYFSPLPYKTKGMVTQPLDTKLRQDSKPWINNGYVNGDELRSAGAQLSGEADTEDLVLRPEASLRHTNVS